MSSHNTHLWPNSFCGSGIQEWLRWVAVAQVLRKLQPRRQPSLKSSEAWPRCRICCQARSCKPLAGGLSSSPRGLCTAAHDMASPWASDRGGRKPKIKATGLYKQILKVTNHHFYHILLVTRACGYQGAGVIVGHLGGWLPQVQLTSFSRNRGMG